MFFGNHFFEPMNWQSYATTKRLSHSEYFFLELFSEKNIDMKPPPKDAENEGKVQKALDDLVHSVHGNCSVVLIAHRLSTVIGLQMARWLGMSKSKCS